MKIKEIKEEKVLKLKEIRSTSIIKPVKFLSNFSIYLMIFSTQKKTEENENFFEIE
jgi:hypothetical protein